jgi:hypothetical protein
MRRVLSIILFVLGGWLFTSELMMAWIDPGEGVGMQIGMLAVLTVFAAPFLLLGTWASPGRRWRELGLTMMIAAGVGLFAALTVFMVMHDPSMKQYMPPDQPMPEFKFAPLVGAVNVLLNAAVAWLLYQSSSKADPGSSPG